MQDYLANMVQQHCLIPYCTVIYLQTWDKEYVSCWESREYNCRSDKDIFLGIDIFINNEGPVERRSGLC